MTKTIIYIAPATSQCRMYKLDMPVDAKIPDYRDNPSIWTEVGLMNFQGKMVCFGGTEQQRQEIADCEPLMAGMIFVFES